jgi:hypothetical protein
VTAGGMDGAANLRLQLAQLRHDLADKVDSSDFAALGDDVAGQVAELAGLRRRTDEIAASVEALERELRHELATTVAGLVRRLHYLDRRAREADGATVVDLTPGPDLVALAARAELGESLREQLLDPPERERRERAVRAAREWRTEHRQALAGALAASLAIARSTAGSGPRHAALIELRPARVAVEDLRGRRAEVLAAAELGQKELAADAEVARRHADAIEQGRRAWTSLCTRLRSRLGEVIDRAELTPRWFDAELGPGPLPADADAWLDAGAELLAYRATYGVVDETSALGPAPGAGASPRQRGWHARLVAGFRAFR